MKKIYMFIIAAAMVCAVSACGDKKTENSESISESSAAVTAVTTEHTTEAETVETTERTAVSTSAETAATVTAVSVENFEGFRQDDMGAVSFGKPIEEQDDNTLISAGQAIFEKACKTEWDFTVGCPYDIDNSQFIENEFGWRYYLITNEGVNSVADVKADYHKVFCDNYSDVLEELFVEANGRAYCLNGARGSHLFYDKSEISAVKSRSEDEICFTVTNYYTDDDYGSGSNTEEADFVIVKESDGIWRVSKFTLPY